VDRRDREILLKNKELQDITLILSKRDKEMQTLRKDIEVLKQATKSEEEVNRMKDYVKSMEMEFK
jgi:hypothetical protein